MPGFGRSASLILSRRHVAGMAGALVGWTWIQGSRAIHAEENHRPLDPVITPDPMVQGGPRPDLQLTSPGLSRLSNPAAPGSGSRTEGHPPRSSETDECIIVVGTTGTGKSSTIAKFTGQSVYVSRRADSVTRECQVFPDSHDSSAPVWVDTVGYDDSHNLSDQESFQEVLQFIDRHDLRKVKAIVWTVMSQERKDARLQKQADFINQFQPGQVWDNVLILVKHPGSFNLEYACQGALEAAKVHAPNGVNIKTLGFTYIDAAIPEKVSQTFHALPEEVRAQMLLATDENVRMWLAQKLDEIEAPIQVIFRDHQCLDCGAVGDRRLLPPYCHFDLLFKHPKSAQLFHPEESETYHSLAQEAYHPGVLRIVGGPNEECEWVKKGLTATAAPLIFLDPVFTGPLVVGATAASWFACAKLAKPLEERYSCCEASQSTAGCAIRWRCCRSPEANEGCLLRYQCCRNPHESNGCLRKYLCCNQDEGSVGCVQVCRKCDAPWGSAANKCYRKEHNLIKVEE